MARPTKLTPALQKKIVDLIRGGNFAAQACAACGIAPSTYYNWMRDAKDYQALQQEGHKLNAAQRAKVEFLHAVKTAEAQAEADAIGQIRLAAARGTWQAAAWYLERRAGERWGRREALEVETTVREVEAKPKSHEELLAELQKLEQEGR